MIRALILDFDGLILDTETPLLGAWNQVHQDAGLEFDLLAGQKIIGHSGVAYNPWQAFGPNADIAALETQFQSHKDKIIRFQPILPGVERLLEHARSLGVPTAVASNSFHDHVDSHLQRLGLKRYFKTTICRDDVSHPKPAPDVYHAACAALGVDPHHAVAFEDSPPGHEAAHAAGLRVVVIPNPSTVHYDFPHATIRLVSLAELSLPDLFAKLDSA